MKTFFCLSMNAFVFTSPSHVHLFMLILLINQIYNHFHHDVLFLGAALGNHQGDGDEGVVETHINLRLPVFG